MKRHFVFSAALVGSAMALTSSAFALSAADLVGAWQLTSATGFDKGTALFDANGHFAIELYKSNIPSYGSGVRTKGTPEEYKATVEGSNALYGTYKLSGADLLLHIEASMFPNWNGADQKRANLTISGGELKWTTPAPSSGGPANETVWKRAN
jgi:hypothetical protein